MTEVNGSEPSPQQELPPQQVLCLFMIVVDLDGSSRAVLNTNERFLAHREASPKDVYPAVANVAADFQGLKTAEAVASFQLQMARSAQVSTEAPGSS